MATVINLDDSSDIEILDHTESNPRRLNRCPTTVSEPMRCQFCNEDIEIMDTRQRQSHYDAHFHDESTPSSSTSSSCASGNTSMNSRNKDRPPSTREHWRSAQDEFWHPARETAPPQNYTPDLIPALKRALVSSHERGFTTRAVLCYPRTVHIYRETWDARWGCGYRNYVMACIALMDQSSQPSYFAPLNTPKPPGVRNLQALLEDAWKHGYDEEGAEQLKHKLVGANKWIGTADLYVAFTYRGIPVELADFNLSNSDIKPLLDWVKAYFTPLERPKGTGATVHDALYRRSPVTVTDKMPLVLQHEGHSRLVVGYEIMKDGSTNLLMFDPSKRVPDNLRAEVHSRSETAGDISGHHHRGKRLMQQALRPFRPAEGKRRRSSKSPKRREQSPFKRMRAGQGQGQDVIVIDDDDDDDDDDEGNDEKGGQSESGSRGKASTGDTVRDFKATLKHFRIEEKMLAKKEKYQILWFPLGPLLDEKTKRERRVVTSERVC